MCVHKVFIIKHMFAWTAYTQRHALHVKGSYIHVDWVMQENLWGPEPPCERTEGSGANLRRSGLPASPLSSAPPNYAVKVALHALHMPESFTNPRNKLGQAHYVSRENIANTFGSFFQCLCLLCAVQVSFSYYLKGSMFPVFSVFNVDLHLVWQSLPLKTTLLKLHPNMVEKQHTSSFRK